MGVCLDTAHTFEAGYDITTEEGLGRTLDLVERTVGLDRVYVLHVNDSKTPLGSRVDRHEHIGRGKIGLEAFRRILNHPRLGPGSQGLAGARLSWKRRSTCRGMTGERAGALGFGGSGSEAGS